MLSQETVNIVKSTSPILQEHGETLTQHFYKRMFLHNPEVAPYFNPTNQAKGTQPRALAAAICAYAANIDNLEALTGAVELIAHKHASLMIKAEHYPIVGQNLLASIKEVLGDGATDEIINAWGQAYQLLADICIEREKQIYKQNKDKIGGWQGFKPFKVIKKEKESSIVTSFYLQPENGDPLPTFSAGQYISLRVGTEDRSITMRNYSLSDKPGQSYFRISVKKEMGVNAATSRGYVSNKLHDEVEVDDVLDIGPPCGDFVLNYDTQSIRPIILLAAGIGITPLFSMLRSALESMPNRQLLLIHSCINESVQPFKQSINTLNEKHPNLTVHYRYSAPEVESTIKKSNCSTGFIDAKLIDSLAPNKQADYYFCGPKPFMASIYENLLSWQIPEEQIHFEFFGPKEQLI